MRSSANISLLFTKSITNDCFLSFPDEIALPILCKYVGLLPVFAASITPEILFKCTPSSIIPTQYINFKCLELELLNACSCLLLVLSLECIPYISGSPSISPNHSLAFDILSFISSMSLQKIIYFPSCSVIFSFNKSGIPLALSDFFTSSSYSAFNSSFLSPSTEFIFSNNDNNSSSLIKSGTTYLGGYIIPASIASNNDISSAIESSKSRSATFAPSFLIGVADKPNSFACGHISNNRLNFCPHLFS